MQGFHAILAESASGPGHSDRESVSYNGLVSVTVLLFAGMAEKAGWRRRVVEVSAGDSVAAVRDRIVAELPALAPFVPTLVYALDETYVRDYETVPDGATLAFIPPVSGG